MRLFLDTEYTDAAQRDLISLALVSEDGHHVFYAERNDYRADWASDFVRKVVLPLLGRYPEAICSRSELRQRLRDWFSTLPRRVRIACDAKTDQLLLWELFAADTPTNLDANIDDIRAIANSRVFFEAALRYHSRPHAEWHHALYDAHAHRCGWLAWMDQRRQERLAE